MSADMRDVLDAAEADVERAALARDMFVHRVRKQIGAYLAAAGPVDAIVFGGGIGERSASIRRLVCSDMAHLGIAVDQAVNDRAATTNRDISTSQAEVRTLVVAVHEMTSIATEAARLATPDHH